MKATKYLVTVQVEVLSLDAVPGLLNAAREQMEHEFTEGKLEADDGDTVAWNVHPLLVTF